MPSAEEIVCGAEEVESLIAGMAASIWEGCQAKAPLCLVGVRTRGATLADRLARELTLLTGENVLTGAVDITLYRDDLDEGRRWPVLRGTEIPFPVDGAEIILVDDVLFTGRTTRAALNAICDLGRPDQIRLGVLIDRGHRELPIQPNLVGLNLATNRSDRVHVRLQPFDPVDEIIRVTAAPRHSSSDRSSAT